MGNVIILWINLPFIIKVFLFIIILYLYLMLCMQIYTRLETMLNRYRKWRYKNKSEKYLDLIQASLSKIAEGIPSSGLEESAFLEKINKKKDTYLLDLWIYHSVLAIREVMQSDFSPEEVQLKKQRLVHCFSSQELYRTLVLQKKRYGDLNALVMLGELRDRNAIPVLKEYEERFKEELNFYFGYNIVLAYAKMGDYESFIRSYSFSNIPNEINDDGLFVHILNSYEGNLEELIRFQTEALGGNKLNQSILAVKYFDSNNIDQVKDLILEKLKWAIDLYSQDKSNLRVLDMAMACIRYFQGIDSSAGDQYIIQLVDCPIWEVRVVAINYLLKLEKSMVEEILLTKVTDSNWQIRHNAAKALVKMRVDKEKLNQILLGEDRYAKEALEYAIEKRVGRYELG